MTNYIQQKNYGTVVSEIRGNTLLNNKLLFMENQDSTVVKM